MDFHNETESHYSLGLLERLSSDLTPRSVELVLTCNDAIAQLNRSFRGIDAPTDVLSFPSADKGRRRPLGSIVISDDYVRKAALEHGHSPQEEFALLYIHGLLHLLGYDHECDNGEMRQKEEALIRKYALPQSLIVRTMEA
ncbi:MAG: rRNA maturation RNase YbeY [Campylobacterales bacterium]|nr:rRNA maturation RNase YbeY [Campylobacterales bacterium]